jgi:hypothetical protein
MHYQEVFVSIPIRGNIGSTSQFWYVHAGDGEGRGEAKQWDQYHAANQRQDALDALRRALEVNPTQIEIRRQIHELEAANTDASATRLTTMIECALRHISEPTPLFTEDKTIHIKTLNLEDEEEWYTEGEGSEEVSDEFESDQDDDAHYFTSDAGDLNP